MNIQANISCTQKSSNSLCVGQCTCTANREYFVFKIFSDKQPCTTLSSILGIYMYFSAYNFCTSQAVRKYFNNEIVFTIYGTCTCILSVLVRTFIMNGWHCKKPAVDFAWWNGSPQLSSWCRVVWGRDRVPSPSGSLRGQGTHEGHSEGLWGKERGTET